MNLLKAPFGEAVLLLKVHSVGGLAVGTASQCVNRTHEEKHDEVLHNNHGVQLRNRPARAPNICVHDGLAGEGPDRIPTEPAWLFGWKTRTPNLSGRPFLQDAKRMTHFRYRTSFPLSPRGLNGGSALPFMETSLHRFAVGGKGIEIAAYRPKAPCRLCARAVYVVALILHFRASGSTAHAQNKCTLSHLKCVVA